MTSCWRTATCAGRCSSAPTSPATSAATWCGPAPASCAATSTSPICRRRGCRCDFTGSQFREADLTNADLEGANFTDTDLFGAIFAGARLAGADLRGAEVSGLDIATLASHAGLKIDAGQQYPLLTALGVDVAVKREG